MMVGEITKCYLECHKPCNTNWDSVSKVEKEWENLPKAEKVYIIIVLIKTQHISTALRRLSFN